ncbi:blast:Speckle-type POZ protein-like [Drosophila guanche]|uniref:Blast:Speckle-type POZ protein-like n=1 Tax=Drosophila guanche TaxID=7266 RepID=A0A3B0JBV1_DROGU|nr:blast:Speckle-type POZ protein-like [Drosophila guanche]
MAFLRLFQMNSSAMEVAVTHHKEQANGGSLLGRRYAELLHGEKYTDCVFHVCEEQLKCHKLILSAASPVFEAMFFGPMQESEPQIEIHDISAAIFKVLLECIYTGSVDYNGLELVACIELYYAAEKYLLDELIADSLVAITRKLRFSNILPALELSVCMGLDSLLEVCMTFFMRCCVNNAQYMTHLKEHYVHVSKECVKTIIAACKEPHKLLIWYVYEWTQQECEQLGLGPSDADLVVHGLGPEANSWPVNVNASDEAQSPAPAPIVSVERCYYKACRPFTVDAESPLWRLRLRSPRFISLMGVVINSRLPPNLTGNFGHVQVQLPLEYRESLRLDLCELPADGVDAPSNPVWSHIIQNQSTKYNCDLHLSWRREEACVLTPELSYELQIRWDGSAYGAEYPCSVQSCLADGIRFIDSDSFSGSLVKGLRYANLV